MPGATQDDDARGGGSQEPPPGASGTPTGASPAADDIRRARADRPLLDELARSQRAGLVGPGDLDAQVAHALGFGGPVPPGPLTCVDLGAGGGLPGLVLARVRPRWRLVLVDAAARRCRHLQGAVDRLGIGDRVEVVHARAEDLGRGPRRGSVEVVVARSFGPPAVVAECAAPLLAVGGRVVVSEPPDATDRWPAEGLALLGLRPGGAHRTAYGYQVLVQDVPCPERFPRRPGIPAKRPLF